MRCYLLTILLWLPLCCWSVVETYEFDDEVTRQRYQQFIDELRCPKCQNQNLAGSDAPIAADLRRELYRLLEEGRSDQEIVNFMVSRYGDFVLYRPRFNADTAVLWLAPAGFLLLGIAVVVLIYRRQKNANVVAVDDAPLNEAEQARLRALLKNEAVQQKEPGDA